MHDIWNPWHGCTKISEGCRHCYMYFLDRKRGMDGSRVFRTQSGFSYPLQKGRDGRYKIKRVQSEMAYKAGVNHTGQPMHFVLRNPYGRILEPEQLYKPFYRTSCDNCGSRLICNGCSNCGRCK